MGWMGDFPVQWKNGQAVVTSTSLDRSHWDLQPRRNKSKKRWWISVIILITIFDLKSALSNYLFKVINHSIAHLIALVVSRVLVMMNENYLAGNRLTEARNKIAAEKNTTLRRPVLLTMILQMHQMSSLPSTLDTSSVFHFPKREHHTQESIVSHPTQERKSKTRRHSKQRRTASSTEQFQSKFVKLSDWNNNWNS